MPKRCKYYNKDEDNSLNTLNDISATTVLRRDENGFGIRQPLYIFNRNNKLTEIYDMNVKNTHFLALK